ncbi:MAG: dihydroneopterin aldolase [Marinicaulis sp.]|nr:dihydroneopterin aldolase [Marinicaulis sp.]NNE41392.1 dihydroneopterin aldolase [Marinicaulis sp.]NNL89440.1 dihydroneopterin aldolase [Marinicaulis sp.]
MSNQRDNFSDADIAGRRYVRTVFLRDLELNAFIGVYDYEQASPQPVLINLRATVQEPEDPILDDLSNAVCYNKLCEGIKEIIARGHIKLVETLAEEVADLVLAHEMVNAVCVSVEKTNAISEAAGAGVEIFRSR